MEEYMNNLDLMGFKNVGHSENVISYYVYVLIDFQFDSLIAF